MMAARFQRDIQRPASGTGPRFLQGVDLGVWSAKLLVPADAAHLPIGIQHHSPHHWIGFDTTNPAHSQIECLLHVERIWERFRHHCREPGAVVRMKAVRASPASRYCTAPAGAITSAAAVSFASSQQARLICTV